MGMRLFTSTSLRLLLVVSLSTACSQGDPASPGSQLQPDAGAADASSSCPSDLPSACPVDAGAIPSYAGEIKAIIAERCFPCHAPGGVAVSAFDFSHYDGAKGVHQNAAEMLSNVYACVMPPSDAGAPTEAERQALLTWLICKAPNN